MVKNLNYWTLHVRYRTVSISHGRGKNKEYEKIGDIHIE